VHLNNLKSLRVPVALAAALAVLTFAGAAVPAAASFTAWTSPPSLLSAWSLSRARPCSGVIGGTFYDAGGYINNAGAATTINESFTLSTDKSTTTLAPIPQGTMFGGSAVVSGQLYMPWG
jgi:hypothetical protein